jgi:hypothetical protein
MSDQTPADRNHDERLRRLLGEPEPGDDAVLSDPEMRRLLTVLDEIDPDDHLDVPPPDVWDAIAAETGLASAEAVSPASTRAESAPVVPLRRGAPPPWWLGAAAALLVVLVVAIGALAIATGDGAEEQIATAALDVLVESDARGAASLVRISDDDDLVLVLDVDGLEPIDGYYEVWLLTPEVDGLVSLGPLRTDGRYELPPGLDHTLFGRPGRGLAGVEAGVAHRLVAGAEVGVEDLLGAAEALGDVVAGELDVDAAGPGALGAVGGEEARRSRRARRRSGGSCGPTRGEGVAVHRVAGPHHRVAGVAHRGSSGGSASVDLVGAHAGDEREPAGDPVGVERSHSASTSSGWRWGRACSRSGCARRRELDVGAVELAGALADPEHVGRAVVPVAGERVLAGEGLLVAEDERLVAGVEVDLVELGVVSVSMPAGRHEAQGPVDLVGEAARSAGPRGWRPRTPGSTAWTR